MIVDASVARSFAVVGWSDHLVNVVGGRVRVADGVHSQYEDGPSELRRIRAALQRQAESAGFGSGTAGRALAAVSGLDQLLGLDASRLEVLTLDEEELYLAVRLQSRLPEDREWRRSLGAQARRLDAGEAASIAIAFRRSLGFASDDKDALDIWAPLTLTTPLRTRDLFKQLVAKAVVSEADAHATYDLLQTDDLHYLGGPGW